MYGHHGRSTYGNKNFVDEIDVRLSPTGYMRFLTAIELVLISGLS